MPFASLLIFLGHLNRLADHAANACQTGTSSQSLDRNRQEAGMQSHVTIHQQQISASTVLKAELRARTARSIFRSVQLHYANRMAARDVDGAVAGTAIGQYDLSVDLAKGGKRALDRCRDVLFFVQCFDDNADRQLLQLRCRSAGASGRADARDRTAGVRNPLAKSWIVGAQHEAFSQNGLLAYQRSHANDGISESRTDRAIKAVHLAAEHRGGVVPSEMEARQ